jgi:hypothetical protein
VQSNLGSSYFHFRRAAFSWMLKSECGLILNLVNLVQSLRFRAARTFFFGFTALKERALLRLADGGGKKR